MTAEALLTSVCSPLMKKPARRVCVCVDRVGAITLHAIDEALPLHVGRDTVEDEVAELIGREVQIAVAREVCKLPVDAVDLLLQRDHVVVVLLELRSLSSDELKVCTPNGVKAGSWPGLLGIWN